MTDLAAWLLEQLAEDERVARKNTGDQGLGGGDYPDYRTYGGPDIDAADEFIGHFTSARMLAKSEADRRILSEIVPEVGGMAAQIENEFGTGRRYDTADEKLLRLLALPYADRPGYDPAWKVES